MSFYDRLRTPSALALAGLLTFGAAAACDADGTDGAATAADTHDVAGTLVMVDDDHEAHEHDDDHDRADGGTDAASAGANAAPGHAAHEGVAHPAAVGLADPVAATHVAAVTGDWTASSTWAGAQVPGEGSRVHIPAGITVTVDSQLTPEIKSIGVDGVLRFATQVDTELKVDTLVTTPQGTLEIGTPEQPVAAGVVASVVFADDGPIDRAADPSLLGRGALLHGRTVVQGEAVTHRGVVASYPRAGDTSVTVQGELVGWDAGDEIVITGTNGPTSDERRVITAVDGSTVRFADPLALDHVPPASDLDLYVANLTRNVRFSSENPDIERRGHLMVMHTLDAQIRGAQFTDMGRTDKSKELEDIDFGDIDPGGVGWDGSFVTLDGRNVRGRYTVHFHRGGADPSTTPAVIADSVVTGDPGWAFTNHSSHVDFLRNVAYGNAGAGFFTEAGDETGRWVDNIAIRTVMPNFVLDDAGAIDPDLRAGRQDFGVDGDGFWLQGNRVDLIGNVAAGSSAHGIIWWSESLAEADLGRVATVDVATLPDPSLVPNREHIDVWWAPLGEVRDNTSYGAVVGVRARYIHGASYLEDPNSPPAAYIETLEPTIDGLTVWDVRDGVLMNYNERLTLRNIRAIGIAEPFRHNFGHTAAVGVGLDLGNDATFGPGAVENVDLRGFEVGFIGPRHGAWTVDGLTTAATTDVLLHGPLHTERSLDMSNLSFASLDGTPLVGRDGERRNVVLAYEYAGDGDGVDPSTAGERDGHGALLADRVTWDGQGLYSPAQAGDVVVADVGMTNADLFAQRGTATGGALLPDDAQPDARVVNGLVGSPAPMPVITHTPGAGAMGADDEGEGDDIDEDSDDDSDDDEMDDEGRDDDTDDEGHDDEDLDDEDGDEDDDGADEDGDELDEGDDEHGDDDREPVGGESVEVIAEQATADIAALLASLDREASELDDEFCADDVESDDPLRIVCAIRNGDIEVGDDVDASELGGDDEDVDAIELLEDVVFDALDRIEEAADGELDELVSRCSESEIEPDATCLFVSILHGDGDDE